MSESRGQSFPLIFLFLLVGFAAVFLRIATPIVHSIFSGDSDQLFNTGPSALEAAGFAVGVGAVIGFFYGWIRGSRKRSIFYGVLLGIGIGWLFSPVVSMPGQFSPLANLAFFVFALVLLAAGTVQIERQTAKAGQTSNLVPPLSQPDVDKSPPE